MSDEIKILNVFDGMDAVQKNALITAMTECGKDFAKSQNRLPHDNSLYDWMEKTQKIEMINGIVKKLSELGYEIVKKDERSGKPETD
jgi:predicted hydrocarbon binding protein